MKILVTGITGFVGRHLAECWKDRSDIELFGTGRSSDRNSYLPATVGYLPLEITNKEAVINVVSSLKPDLVIHSAAMSKPNDCELEKDKCLDVNVNATKYVVDACKNANARLIFMSSDMVFGDNGPYKEEDEFCPVNYYGESKVLAEQLVAASGLDYAIVRTVLVYGSKLAGQNGTFLHWVYNNIFQGKTIRVFTDQHRTACYVNDLCAGIDALVRTGQQGVYHICGKETFTPFEIARTVARFHGLSEDLVQPVTNVEMPEVALRPRRSTLNVEKAESLLGYRATPLSEALKASF
jgi:dTDP-4-dehydrorhamnose reductase